MKNIKTFYLLLSMILTAVFAVTAQDITPASVENPNIRDAHNFVADPGHSLSPGATAAVNDTLYALRKATTAEVAVAILPNLGDNDIENFAQELYKEWGLGKKGKDNGVLLLVDMEGHKVRIETGYGMEGVVTDALASTIINDTFVPRMKDGGLDGAVTGAVNILARVISDPKAAEAVVAENSDDGIALSSDVLYEFIGWVSAIVMIIMIFVYIYQCRRLRKENRYHKALAWKRSMWLYWFGALFSFGPAVLIALLALWRYRRARTAPRKCNHCGTKMKRLSEKEDNVRLSPSEDLEERLGSIDYDVWECPKCGAVDKYAFPQRQMKYTRCPACGTVAMHIVGDFTKVPATTRRAGVGERVYECKYCGHQKHDEYKIPRKEDGAVAAAAALGAASVLGRGGSGGGFGGGGFGGGMSGGGGASGGW